MLASLQYAETAKTRSAPSSYDDDFYAWSQEQAVALRRLRETGSGGHVDLVHVAEEIEDLGKRDLRQVASLLARLIEHLVKIETGMASPERAHWNAEATHFQASAVAAFSPSMRRVLDFDKVWGTGRRAPARYLAEVGRVTSVPAACPFTIDELLADPFDIDAALKLVAA